MDEKEGTQAIFGQQGATCAEIGEMPNWPTPTLFNKAQNMLARRKTESMQRLNFLLMGEGQNMMKDKIKSCKTHHLLKKMA